MDCKILALKVLDSCDKNFSKVLEVGTLYKFYNNYLIDDFRIESKNTALDALYNVNDLKINISAIVGKNGTGKSTLVELLIRAINNVAYISGLNNDIDVVYDLGVELYFKTNAFYKFILLDDELEIFQQKFEEKKLTKIRNSEFNYNAFFYSIVINYSHFGLNSKEIGTWINGLFHKNDGYQTPVVLNPMRTNGIIDINSETSLTKARFISNLLSRRLYNNYSQLKITEKLFVSNIQLQLKQFDDPVIYQIVTSNKSQNNQVESESKSNEDIHFSDLNVDANLILERLNQHIDFGFQGNYETGNPVTDLAYIYLVTKLVKIATTYPFYYEYFDRQGKNFIISKFDFFLELLLNKNANHIAFKFKQVLNFLIHQHIKVLTSDPFNVNLNDYAKTIEEIIAQNDLDPNSKIELIPPPIFKINIFLKSESINEDVIVFDSLSSGEKQQIFSINTILYHLINIDSIGKMSIQKGYRFINIIFEEIELYFHPEFQRTFIELLLSQLKEIQFTRVKEMNICFVTHSPFVLSDIPKQNILFLSNVPIDKELIGDTFGANIHELLKSSFFLDNGFLGEFSRRKINEVIKYLNSEKINSEINTIYSNDSIMVALKKKELEIINEEIIYESREYYKAIIDSIGEPVVKYKLVNMYNEVFNIETQDEKIQKEIDRLQKLLNEK